MKSTGDHSFNIMALGERHFGGMNVGQAKNNLDTSVESEANNISFFTSVSSQKIVSK